MELHVHIGSVLLAIGRRDSGRAALRVALDAFEERLRMGADEPFTRYYVAAAWALLREKERALDALERAARQRPAYTIERARIDPDFESLRGEARFKRLLENSRAPANGVRNPMSLAPDLAWAPMRFVVRLARAAWARFIARTTEAGPENVAIKVLPPRALRKTRRARGASRGKRKLLAALNHPSIAAIYGFASPGSRCRFPPVGTFSSWSCSRARRCGSA